jgi:arylsulfatase
MEVYAAQIDRMDQGIGRIVRTIERAGALENTLILFLADNGGCAEELGAGFADRGLKRSGRERTRDGRAVRAGNDPQIMPGGEDTYQSCGVPWANVSNTPFRLYKHWVHEGGIATPLIVHWPAEVKTGGELRRRPGQLPDVMATCVDVSGAKYPKEHDGREVLPLEGHSLMPIVKGDRPNGREALYWEHEGNCAVRRGKWKLVKRHPGDWELYDMEADRTETVDLAGERPDLVDDLAKMYVAWAGPRNVVPWADLTAHRKRRRNGRG